MGRDTYLTTTEGLIDEPIESGSNPQWMQVSDFGHEIFTERLPRPQVSGTILVEGSVWYRAWAKQYQHDASSGPETSWGRFRWWWRYYCEWYRIPRQLPPPNSMVDRYGMAIIPVDHEALRRTRPALQGKYYFHGSLVRIY